MGLQPTPPPPIAVPPPPPSSPSAAPLKRKASEAAAKEAIIEAKKPCLDDSAVSMEVEEEVEVEDVVAANSKSPAAVNPEPKVIVEHQPLPSIYELQQNNEETTTTNNSR